jgi:glutamate racemase
MVLKSAQDQPIGVFDSGFGGLTVLRELTAALPEHDFLYLGDNARAPYGSRSFETVYHYTLECVRKLFDRGCHLVVLACNTASAKALRSIQQKDLPVLAPGRRVLGVLRPTTELAGTFSGSGSIGILGTQGTVDSGSYLIEIEKFFPALKVYQEACPMWVPLIENGETENEAADFFIRRHVRSLLDKDRKMDAIILACTHYPIIIDKIRRYTGDNVKLISQGPLVASGLKDYLKRHPEMDIQCSKGGKVNFLTTDDPAVFDRSARLFYGAPVTSGHLEL